MAKIIEELELELEWDSKKQEWSYMELERYVVELELELEWNFKKSECSCVELE